MKMRALKTLAFGIAMTMMVASTGVFADSSSDFGHRHGDRHCLGKWKIEHLKDRLRRDLEIHFSSLNNIFTYLGASANPNPGTNAAVAGLIAANVIQINAAGEDGLEVLRQLGVPENAIEVINAQVAAFDSDAIAYALAVNLANTGQPAPDQVVLALALEADAAALGTSLLALTHDPVYPGLLTELANLITQNVQAYRLVLADGNAFGANPALPATETAAAVAINARIAQLVAQVANTLVPKLAHDKCSGDF